MPLVNQGVTVLEVTTQSNPMPVCQVATGEAFKEQVATSLVVAPVIVMAGCAWEVPAPMAVPLEVEVPEPMVKVTVVPPDVTGPGNAVVTTPVLVPV